MVCHSVHAIFVPSFYNFLPSGSCTESMFFIQSKNFLVNYFFTYICTPNKMCLHTPIDLVHRFIRFNFVLVQKQVSVRVNLLPKPFVNISQVVVIVECIYNFRRRNRKSVSCFAATNLLSLKNVLAGSKEKVCIHGFSC